MRNASVPFAGKGEYSDSCYDLFYDYGLIEASFAQQYGIRLRNEDDMSFDEFKTLLAGLNGDTPLGAVVQIRAERDRSRINKFTAQQRRMRSEWAAFRARKARQNNAPMDMDNYNAAMKSFAALFRSLAGGEDNKR